MTVRILKGDCREVLRSIPKGSVNCVVTSPPYFGLRDYGMAGQIGLETTPAAYVDEMVAVFSEVRRVLRDDGTLWLNLGDSYVANRGNSPEKPGHDNKAVHSSLAIRDFKIPGKPKDLIGIPWLTAFALRDMGWWLRQDIIWSKPNPMPESVLDRCTKAHEYLFLLSKSGKYYYDATAIAEPAIAGFNGSSFTSDYDRATKPGLGTVERVDRSTRNKRSVWDVATSPYSEAHFATFPPALIEPCILAGCPEDGTVLDPFGGAGTTGMVADRLGRNAILIELNPEYAAMAERRINSDAGMFADVR